MNFETGITNLTNWLGNVIMPTVGALFIVLAIIRYAKGYSHQYIAWAGFLCLMVSGLLRALEHFATAGGWNNPDVVWLTLRGLVNWLANVFMPVYAAAQVVQGITTYTGIGHRLHAGQPWIRHIAAAGMAMMCSGLIRVSESFVTRGTAGIS